MAISPTAEGFRAAFRRPSLTFAEIMWRWSVGGTAAAVLLFGVFQYLETLPVTNGELLLLHTRQPYLVGEAIAHILRGSLNRAVMSAMVATLMLTILWILAASAGRRATVGATLNYFRRDVASNVSAGSIANPEEHGADVFRSLVKLNFLRAAVTLASIVAFVGASILAGFASPAAHPRPGLAFLLFLPLAILISAIWSTLNWILTMAGLFAVRDGEDAMGAISAAVSFSRNRAGPISAVSIWTGMAHLVAFVVASTVVTMPLGFIAIVQWRAVVAVMLLITLIYFALADWIYIARQAGYLCIAEMPEAIAAPLPPQIQITIDREEPILSDIPGILPANS